MTQDDDGSAPMLGSRPFPKVSPDRLLEILRMNCESGDILCGDAADEIERLRLTDAERQAIQASMTFWSRGYGPHGETLRGLLERLG